MNLTNILLIASWIGIAFQFYFGFKKNYKVATIFFKIVVTICVLNIVIIIADFIL